MRIQELTIYSVLRLTMPSNKKSKKGSAPKTGSKDVQKMTLEELDALLDEMKIKEEAGGSDADSVMTLHSAVSTLVDTDTSAEPAIRPSSHGLHIPLPPWLLDSLHKEYPNAKTLLYSDKAFNVRRTIRDFKFSASSQVSASALDLRATVNIKASLPGSVFNWDNEKKDVLHYAVHTADLPLVYEYLYLGLDPDYRDSLGESVFASAVRLLSEMESRSRKGRLARDPTPRDDPTYLRRLTEIIKLFASQHADVNQTFKGKSLLQIACRSNAEYNWEVITVLLQYGASVDKPLSAYFGTKHDQDRLSKLARDKRGAERPERVCPCWSGMVVSECHGAPDAQVPYPDSYICFCGSGKSHEACCKKRWLLVESWDPALKRIEVYSQSKMRLDAPSGHEEVMRRIQMLDFGEEGDEGVAGVSEPSTRIPFRNLTKERLEAFRLKMIELKLVDPAFAFAMKITRFPLLVISCPFLFTMSTDDFYINCRWTCQQKNRGSSSTISVAGDMEHSHRPVHRSRRR